MGRMDRLFNASATAQMCPVGRFYRIKPRSTAIKRETDTERGRLSVRRVRNGGRAWRSAIRMRLERGGPGMIARLSGKPEGTIRGYTQVVHRVKTALRTTQPDIEEGAIGKIWLTSYSQKSKPIPKSGIYTTSYNICHVKSINCGAW